MAEVRPIDANALENSIKYFYCNGCKHYCRSCQIDDALTAIDDAPTIEYAPVRHGEWIEQEDICGDTYYTCSACKEDWVCIDGTPAEKRNALLPQMWSEDGRRAA